ncbi:MAG: hypothetical protein H6599_08525 [Flavobacteriales bacterium]|nr:hypothetical protein [Flavobacteriales bacterium]
MKTIFISLLVLLTVSAKSQSVPSKFNYQAVARDIQGDLLVNSTINATISILSGSSSGSTVFEEEHFLTTNDYGLFYFRIGEGSVLSGQLNNINWEAQDHFLKVQINGEELSNEQLVSVPYSLSSNNTLSIDGNRVSASTPADGQYLIYNGTTSQWEAQSASANGDNWGSQVVFTDATLSGNGTSSSPLSGFDGNYNNLSNLPVVPTLTSQLTNDNGFLTSEVDGDNTNELITGGILNGTDLEISDAGGTTVVDLSSLVSGDDWGTEFVHTDASMSGDGTTSNPLMVIGDLTDDQTLSYNSATQIISISGGNSISLNINDADNDPVNEIQDLQITADILTITNNGSPTSIDLSGYRELPPSGITGDVLKWNGTNWAPAFDNVDDADNNVLNEIQNLSISGNSIIIDGGGSGFNLSATAPANNQVLGWNNTSGQWEAMNAPPNNIYNSDGTLAADRIITQAGSRISFLPTTTDGFNVANNTFSVDGVNQRVGIGISTPAYKFEVSGDIAQTSQADRFVRAGDNSDLLAAAYGHVQSDGTNSGAGTSNYTVTRLSLGTFQINYTGPRTFVNNTDIVFSAVPDATGNSNIFILNYEVTGTNQIQVNTYRLITAVVLAGSTFATADSAFSFELRIK